MVKCLLMKNGPYELVIAPFEYPGKKYRGRYVYLHRLVWWQQTGEALPSGIHVHHSNEKKRDNRFKNLAKKTPSEHLREHRAPAPLVKIKCGWCSIRFERLASDIRFKRGQGQKKFYCSHSCQAYAQQKLIRDSKKK